MALDTEKSCDELLIRIYSQPKTVLQAYQARKIATLFYVWLKIKKFDKTKTGKSCSLLSLSFEFVLEIIKHGHWSEIYLAVLSGELFIKLRKVVLAFDFLYAILQSNHSTISVLALCDGYAVLVISSLAHYFLVQFFQLDCQMATWNFLMWGSDKQH